MNRLKTYILILLITIIVLGVGFASGAYYATHKNNKVVKITDTKMENNKKIIQLSDGSFGLIKDGNCSFYAVEFGDYGYNVDSEKDLNDIVETYIENKNNKEFIK